MSHYKLIEDEVKKYRKTPLRDMSAYEVGKVIDILKLQMLTEIADSLEDLKDVIVGLSEIIEQKDK